MALFSLKLPSFVIIITELSKHDLGELVGEGRKGKERQGKKKRRNCEANWKRQQKSLPGVGSGKKLLRHDRTDLLPPKSPR